MAKGDLDKLMKGEEIYRHEDLKAISEKWCGWRDFLQYSTMGYLVLMIIILEAVGKETARSLVWYLAAFGFLYATFVFFYSRIANKHEMAYLNAEHMRVSDLSKEVDNKIRRK